MKVIVPTHSKYEHLVEPHSTLFHRYCPGHELIYAKQSGPPKTWAESLRGVVEALDEEYFILMMEDVILISPVDDGHGDFGLLIEKVQEGASKAMLDSHLNEECHPDADTRYLELRQSSNNRASLHPAIWRKEYLLKFLRQGFSPWDFEVTGGMIAQNDGAKIVSINRPKDLFYTCNVYRKGVPFPRWDCPRPYGTSGHYVNRSDAEYILGFLP